jgi:hypothetical protein
MLYKKILLLEDFFIVRNNPNTSPARPFFLESDRTRNNRMKADQEAASAAGSILFTANAPRRFIRG